MAKRQYYIAQAVDNKTDRIRSMSWPMTMPILDMGPTLGKVAETMLDDFINHNRPAEDTLTKNHFFNWCYHMAEYGDKNSHIQAHIRVVGEKDYKDFNKFVRETQNA